MQRRSVMVLIIASVLCGSPRAWAEEIRAAYRDLPATFFSIPAPSAAEWGTVDAVIIPLFPQVITTPSLPQTTVPTVAVRAIHNKKWIAVQLVWTDATKSEQIDVDRASDACAIQLPNGAVEKTSPFMGSVDAPVALIHWKAIWQRDVEQGYQDVQDLHPNVWSDLYWHAQGGQPYPIASSFESREARQTLGGIYAKNPVSQLKRTLPVEESMAAGFGSLTTQPQQDARAHGAWAEGRWTVVFARPLVTGDTNDPSLKVGVPTSMAFAIWEGGNNNVGARKNYAPWNPLRLMPRP